MNRIKQKWERGEKSRLAKSCKISPQHLYNILAGIYGVNPKLARKIEEEAGKLGKHLPRESLLYRDEYPNELLIYGKRRRG